MIDRQPIETAPRDGTAIQAEIPGHGQDCKIAWLDGLLDNDGLCCGGWEWRDDRDRPESWTDGICWEVNESGEQSVQPTRWKPPNNVHDLK